MTPANGDAHIWGVTDEADDAEIDRLHECCDQLAALIAIIGHDDDTTSCPWCHFEANWGHGRGCIRAACADIIPVRPRTRRSDR